MELWTGMECAKFDLHPYDCLDSNGHAKRFLKTDLALAKSMNIHTMRYSASLWKKHLTKQPDRSFSDRSMNLFKDHAITPVLDMAHMTDIDFIPGGYLNPDFPQFICKEVKAYKERYPWLTMITPINEPLVSAHFCGRVGEWYPHHASEKSFLTMVVSMAKAICLSAEYLAQQRGMELMIPDSCERHPEEKVMENHIRFLCFDLVFGMVTKEYPLYHHLIAHDISESDIEWFQEHPIDTTKVRCILGHDWYAHSGGGWDKNAELNGGAIPFSDVAMDYAIRYPQVDLVLAETNICGTIQKRMLWLKFILEQCEIYNQKLADDGRELRAVAYYPLISPRGWRGTFLHNPGTKQSDDCGIIEINKINKRILTGHDAKLFKVFKKLLNGTICPEDIPAYYPPDDGDNNLKAFLPFMKHYNWQ